MTAKEEFYKSKYFPHYGAYYLYKGVETLKSDGKLPVVETINLDEYELI